MVAEGKCRGRAKIWMNKKTLLLSETVSCMTFSVIILAKI